MNVGSVWPAAGPEASESKTAPEERKLTAHLATADDRTSPIRSSVAMARNAAMLDQAVALVTAIERAGGERTR